MSTILFNSLVFLYFGIVVLLSIFIIKNRNYQYLFLVVASYFFYWYSSDFFFLLLLFSTLLDFYCGKAIYHTQDLKKRKFFLILSLIGNLGILGIFKYTNFSIETINSLVNFLSIPFSIKTLNIALPIGISFFTFQTMSYTLDIYFRKIKPEQSLLKFGLYISLFPQLVAGPIVRAKDFLPQLRRKILIFPNNFKAGLTLIGWGLVKKIVIADNIAIFVNAFFADPTSYPGSIPVFLATLAFGIQIYCDFSGYSDIAIGLLKIFGFNIKLNFDKPYFATNVREFWRKWHISLSSWLQDYLYIPLGGNKKGKVRTFFNLMTTMLLGGLWHGAAFNFILWGFYHGCLLTIHRLFSILGISKIIDKLGRFRSTAAMILTQYFVFFGWLIFRVSDLKYLFYSMKKFIILDFSAGFATFLELFQTYTVPFFFIGVFLLIHIYTFFDRKFIDRVAQKDLFYWAVYLFLIVLALFFLSPTKTIPFIYFQF